MFEIDKTQFGEFLTSQRKRKGYTQKELAQKLFISDKAVSKWERGLSMPDISLLMPLADVLEVTVTELLEGRRMENAGGMDTDQVENLVKKVLSFSSETPEKVKEKKMKHGLIFGGCLAVVLLEAVIFYLSGYRFSQIWSNHIFIVELLCLIFGIYFWFFIKEKLPSYYDENKISAYSDGMFRINMVGIHFNNSNWPHIVRVGRLWTAMTAVIFPVIYLVIDKLLPDLWNTAGLYITLALVLGGLFVPVYIVGKRYE